MAPTKSLTELALFVGQDVGKRLRSVDLSEYGVPEEATLSASVISS